MCALNVYIKYSVNYTVYNHKIHIAFSSQSDLNPI